VSDQAAPPGAEIMRQFVAHSPLAQHLGIVIDDIGDDVGVLRMPFKAELATFAEVVHGGAIATLMDTAVMVASWSSASVDGPLKGATVSLTTNYTAAANGCDLVATARVTRRGRQLCFCDVSVEGDGKTVAHGVATYKIG
jgi:uncharacterized protein (TIGR00369 family)